MLFKRREVALMRMGELRGFLLQLYQLHSVLDWKAGSGRKNQSNDDPFYLGIEHSDQVADSIIGLFDELMRYLTLPSSTETRHLLTKRGHSQAGYIRSVEEPIFLSCTARRMVRFAKGTTHRITLTICRITSIFDKNEENLVSKWPFFTFSQSSVIRLMLIGM